MLGGRKNRTRKFELNKYMKVVAHRKFELNKYKKVVAHRLLVFPKKVLLNVNTCLTNCKADTTNAKA